MRKPAVCVLVTVVVLNLPLAACGGLVPGPSPPSVATPADLTESVSEVVSPGEETTISRPEYGFSLVIPAGALSEETEVTMRQGSDPLVGGSSRALGNVYDLDLGQAQLAKPLQVSIELPEGQAGEIAEACVIRWTGSEWEYLDTIVREGWATAKVSLGSRFSIGYMTHVVLRGSDGKVERGRLEARRLDDGTQGVIMYDGRGEVIDRSTAVEYRGGLLYRAGQLWTIPPFADLVSAGHIELMMFSKTLSALAADVVSADQDVASKDSESLTLFAPEGWTSSCPADIGDGAKEKAVGLRYREGRSSYSPAIGRGPWLFVEVTEARNLAGDYLYLVFYSGPAAILAVKANAQDMVSGTQYRVRLPLVEDQVPVADSQLIALTVGPPDIAWWRSWKDEDRTLLCAYGGEAGPDERRPANYYVDSRGGSDSNPGTSRDKPWRTLRPVQSRDFLPGEAVLFKRGSSWSGGLVIDDSGVAGNPITFSTYGTGNRPVFRNPGGWQVITINADWVVVEGLLVQEAQEAGVGIMNGRGNVIRGIEATDVGIGIAIRGQHNLATHNYVHDLHMVHNTPGGDDDYGAVGIWFFDSNNEASYNRMVNCKASSYDYGSDGGVFEIYVGDTGEGDNNYFHHNWGTGCNNVFEVSGAGAAKNNLVAYNIFVDNSGNAGVFHIHQGGYGSDVESFRFENNVVVDTTNGGYSLFWFSDTPSATTLTMRNNVFRVGRVSFVFNRSSFTHDHNLYHLLGASVRMSDRDTFVPGEGEHTADPLFVDPAAEDYHLQTDSPAIDAGVELGHSVDYEGRPVPIGTAPDIGVYEYAPALPAAPAQASP